MRAGRHGTTTERSPHGTVSPQQTNLSEHTERREQTTVQLQNDLFAPYMKEHTDIKIERRQMDAPDLGQALQVARRSNQMPDVHSLAGLGGVSPAALVGGGWFQSIGKLADFQGSPVGEMLYDGIHRFNDEIYSFPPFSGR